VYVPAIPSAMIDTAIVFVSGVAAGPELRLGGLGLLERALLNVARAGVRRCFVVGNIAKTGVVRGGTVEVKGLPNEAGAAVEVLHAAGVEDDDSMLCLHANTVFVPQLLRDLVGAYGNSAGALVSVQPDHTGGLFPLPLAIVPLRVLPELWSELANDDETELARWHAQGISAWPTRGRVAMRLRHGTQTKAVERKLLLALENPADGKIDALLNRKLSRPLSRLFLRWRVRPNQITVVSFLVGVLAAAGFACGTFFASLAGALLLQLAAILDCCDGEVARISFAESRLGHVLDITLDALANAAIFAGMAHGAAVTNQLVHAPALGVAALVGVAGAFAVTTYAETRLVARSNVPEYRLVSRLVGAMTTRDFSVIVLLATLTGALPWFLWGAAVGANIFWLLLLALLVRGAAAQKERSTPDPAG